jgi:8-oxo-dGTP pyrophosphatase MutT (NUDIX family)
MSSQTTPPTNTPSAEAIVQQLKQTLPSLHANPYPEIPNPPNVKRRASVAVVLRINPHHEHWPAPSSSDPASNAALDTAAPVDARLGAFFAQDWVQHGDAELLYIKRAARVGDRWNAHVAFPGGRRDPDDADDAAAAVREAWEEVGLDLTAGQAVAVGTLPQRVVTMDWGRTPLMVLCPFVFLLVAPDVPPLRLQAAEVGSTHWVPLRALLSPSTRTTEFQDRYLSRYESRLARFLLWHNLRRMAFPATRLVASESRYSRWEEGGSAGAVAARAEPILWGLTHGITADLLEFVPPFDTSHMWSFPTFTPWDVRLAIWAVTASFRQRVHETFRAVRLHIPDETSTEGEGKDVGMSGVLVASPDGVPAVVPSQVCRADVSNPLLGDYYALVRRAVFLTMVGRIGVAAGAGFWLFKTLKRR